MSSDQKEQFLSIMEEAYEKGRTSRDITVEALFNEIRQKLIQIIEKDTILPKEV